MNGPERHHVTIDLPSAGLSGEKVQGGAQLPLRISQMFERRSRPRLPDSSLVMISWEENGATLNQLGNARNISADGLGLLVDRHLPLGVAVTISSSLGELAGMVRHSSELIDGHLVGIELTGAAYNCVAPRSFRSDSLTPGAH